MKSAPLKFATALLMMVFMSTAALAASCSPKVTDWFSKYGEIRHKAQMTPQEKEKSGQLMTQGLLGSVFKGADGDRDKAASDDLLKKMVDRYTKALAEMDALQSPPETKKLYLGYKEYFSDARAMFSDYLKMSGNLFATDSNGNSIMGQMQQRKAALEALDVQNKELDASLRQKFGIAAYPY